MGRLHNTHVWWPQDTANCCGVASTATCANIPSGGPGPFRPNGVELYLTIPKTDSAALDTARMHRCVRRECGGADRLFPTLTCPVRAPLRQSIHD